MHDFVSEGGRVVADHFRKHTITQHTGERQGIPGRSPATIYIDVYEMFTYNTNVVLRLRRERTCRHHEIQRHDLLLHHQHPGRCAEDRELLRHSRCHVHLQCLGRASKFQRQPRRRQPHPLPQLLLRRGDGLLLPPEPVL